MIKNIQTWLSSSFQIASKFETEEIVRIHSSNKLFGCRYVRSSSVMKNEHYLLEKKNKELIENYQIRIVKNSDSQFAVFKNPEFPFWDEQNLKREMKNISLADPFYKEEEDAFSIRSNYRLFVGSKSQFYNWLNS